MQAILLVRAVCLSSLFSFVAVPAVAESIKVATFNIQNLGQTKIGRPAVMRTLANTMREFDLIAVQEVSDISEEAPQALLDKLNASGRNYMMLLSPRTGEQNDDRSAQEQYAFYFDADTIDTVGDAALFDDSSDDFFQRELSIRFQP